MLQWLVALPLISLLIERLLEVFDLLVTLNVFPFWRTAPAAPPRMFLQRPSRKTWRKGQQMGAPTMADTESAKVVHTIGSDTLEFPVSSYQEAVLYYEKEKALYRNRLKHYVNKYGHFLPRQASVTGDLWVQSSSWPLRLEAQLAVREKIPDVGKEAQFARLVRDVSIDRMASDRSRIQTLEKLADYCYLRNQHTHAAFSFLKRQVYLVLSIGLGILVTELLYRGGVLPGLNQGTVLTTASGLRDSTLVGYVLPAMRSLLGLATTPSLLVFRVTIGGLAGSGSQPVHGLVNWAVRASTGGHGDDPKPGGAQNTPRSRSDARR
jgi:hypothetical protein